MLLRLKALALTTFKRKRIGLVTTFRSGLEEAIAAQLKTAGVPYEYETRKLAYTKPASSHQYQPDFWVGALCIESKGIFDSDDRAKHLLVRAQHPDVEIRFVFSNSRAKLYKGSKTTYGMWCEKNGYLYADKRIPVEWLT